ncbi:MAG: hypothetical protein ACRDIB_12930, partial [Ardenticatenaceae bacterium]
MSLDLLGKFNSLIRRGLGVLLTLGLLLGVLTPRAGGVPARGVQSTSRGGDVHAPYARVINPFAERALLYSSNGGDFDGFGDAVALSADGSLVVVGAPEAFGDGAGKAYLFAQPAGDWGGQLTEAARRRASDGRYRDHFGGAVAISDDGRTIVVGASEHFSTAGAVYVFEQPAGGWSGTVMQTATLRASDPHHGDYLGGAVAISGDTIVAGAFGNDVGGNAEQGTLYLYLKPPTGWVSTTESARLIASDGVTNDYLGGAVTRAGARVVAGAKGADVGSTLSAGATYLFEQPAGGWT